MNADSKKRLSEILDRLKEVNQQTLINFVGYTEAAIGSETEKQFSNETKTLQKEFYSLIEEAKRFCI